VLQVLVDEDLPRSTAALLQSLSIDARDVRDVGLKGASEEQIFEYAQKEGRIIITRDIEFGNILKYPPSSHYGVIVVRLPNTYVRDQILGVIRKFFVEVAKKELVRHIVVLEIDKYRIRPFSAYDEVQDK